jgi:hypothetical protein
VLSTSVDGRGAFGDGPARPVHQISTQLEIRHSAMGVGTMSRISRQGGSTGPKSRHLPHQDGYPRAGRERHWRGSMSDAAAGDDLAEALPMAKGAMQDLQHRHNLRRITGPG